MKLWVFLVRGPTVGAVCSKFWPLSRTFWSTRTFSRSHVVEDKVAKLVAGAREEMAAVEAQGGMVAAVENGYVKGCLVTSQLERLRAIERGDLKIIGLNCFEDSAESPLTGGDDNILIVDPIAEREQIEQLKAHRAGRNTTDVQAALAQLTDAAKSGQNVMPASINCAHAGVTTGEWGAALRECFGEYRAPTGIDIAQCAGDAEALDSLRNQCAELEQNSIGRLALLLQSQGWMGTPTALSRSR